jgi:hypothetical protein
MAPRVTSTEASGPAGGQIDRYIIWQRWEEVVIVHMFVNACVHAVQSSNARPNLRWTFAALPNASTVRARCHGGRPRRTPHR